VMTTYFFCLFSSVNAANDEGQKDSETRGRTWVSGCLNSPGVGGVNSKSDVLTTANPKGTFCQTRRPRTTRAALLSDAPAPYRFFASLCVGQSGGAQKLIYNRKRKSRKLREGKAQSPRSASRFLLESTRARWRRAPPHEEAALAPTQRAETQTSASSRRPQRGPCSGATELP